LALEEKGSSAKRRKSRSPKKVDDREKGGQMFGKSFLRGKSLEEYLE